MSDSKAQISEPKNSVETLLDGLSVTNGNGKDMTDKADKIMEAEVQPLDAMPDALEIKMENPDGNGGTVDCKCEAVAKDDGSVQYECRYEIPSKTNEVINNSSSTLITSPPTGSKDSTPPRTTGTNARITGKFSLNVPYV